MEIACKKKKKEMLDEKGNGQGKALRISLSSLFSFDSFFPACLLTMCSFLLLHAMRMPPALLLLLLLLLLLSPLSLSLYLGCFWWLGDATTRGDLCVVPIASRFTGNKPTKS